MRKINIGTLIAGFLFITAGMQAKAETFAQTVSDLEDHCENVQCREPFRIGFLYRYSQGGEKNYANKKTFETIAFDQAQIWGDTILEGDFYADGITRVDRVARIYRNDKLVAYVVTYSEKAWYLSDCHYDGVRSITLLGCTPGRITESSYVSPDFKTYFYTERTMANFN